MTVQPNIVLVPGAWADGSCRSGVIGRLQADGSLHRVLTEPGLSERMSRHAGHLAPQLLWPAVARCHRELAATVARSRDGAVA